MQNPKLHNGATLSLPREEAIAACREAVTRAFGDVDNIIDGWRIAVEAAVSASSGRMDVATVDELVERLVRDEFGDGSLIVGAGFVAAPGFLHDARWHLAWWLSDANTFGIGSSQPAVRRLIAIEDPSSDGFRDYTTLEWWRIPLESGERHVTGPYVDYLCTDDYTLTVTLPVTHGEETIGLVGVDIYVVDLETILMRPLRAIGSTATLVNRSGRVVASTDPLLAAGALLRSAGLAEWLRATPESASTPDTAGEVSTLADGRRLFHCPGTALALLVDE